MNGFLKRSITEAANCSKSSFAKVKVGITSSNKVLFINLEITSSFIQSLTMF